MGEPSYFPATLNNELPRSQAVGEYYPKRDLILVGFIGLGVLQ